MSVPHPVFWLLDFAELLGDHGSAAPAAASRAHPPRRAQVTPELRPRQAWRLTFGVLDAHHGPVVECHELEPNRPALLEWLRVLQELEGARRLTFWHLDRPA